MTQNDTSVSKRSLRRSLWDSLACPHLVYFETREDFWRKHSHVKCKDDLGEVQSKDPRAQRDAKILPEGKPAVIPAQVFASYCNWRRSLQVAESRDRI